MGDAVLSLSGAPLPVFPSAPRNPAGSSPRRRPGSVRRTASLDASWPDGADGLLYLAGHARDIRTSALDGVAHILSEDRMYARTAGREIQEIRAEPVRVHIGGLAGARAGGRLRAAIDAVLPAERAAGTPLYLLLDDLAGSTLIAGWGLEQWQDPSAGNTGEAEDESMPAEGVCIGFRPGSSALLPRHARPEERPTPVPPLLHPEDPDGWHPLPEHDGPNFRRARRIDVWREAGTLHIDATFQDSSRRCDGRRVGLHEHMLRATADADSGILLSVTADGRILPFPECPAATVNIDVLVGTPLADLRMTVLGTLRKTAGCTHLNDALRALAEVPLLARHLPEQGGQ